MTKLVIKYQSMLGVNIMSNQDLVLKLVSHQAFYHCNSLGIAGKINGWFDLVIRVFDAKEVKLAITTKLRSKISQLSMVLDGSFDLRNIEYLHEKVAL